ncbi:ABC transporter permease [Pseudoalteromonas sp. L21]|uniref:ABC transporter permease n=1 Tax=Pseudoalteromonas sp. L21 TaxID=1539746 RepID=UPI001F009CED|nr:ABC transporter permease [Pseudoalteromonas sp. L21]MCF7520102.1 FtsX-like permease family protein [Pseudoalteromonas sp. L21]
MLVSHITTAFRVFKRHKLYALLNVFGLSIGLAGALLVALFAEYELSFDKMQPDHQQVYRLHVDVNVPGLEEIPLTVVSIAQTVSSRSDVSDLLVLADVVDSDLLSAHINVAGQAFKLRNLYGTSANIRDFIHLEVMLGNLEQVLSVPNQIALSNSEATRLFGSANKAFRQTLLMGEQSVTVGAVFDDLPDNSHFLFHALVSVDFTEHNDISSYVYLKTQQGADLKDIEKLLASRLIEKYQLKNSQLEYRLVPMREVYFKAHSPFEFKPGGSAFLVNLSLVLSVLLLAIAAANYINIAVSQLLYRSKEIAMRKTLGASKRQLILQFLLEALLMVILATLLALCWVEMLLPSFSGFANRPLQLIWDWSQLLAVLGVVFLLAFISGAYPAFCVVRAPLKSLLAGQLQTGQAVRKGLLVFQAAMAMALFVCTIVSLQQLTFLQNLSLGYDATDRIVIHDLSSKQLMGKEHAILNEIRALPGVMQVTTTDTDLTDSILESFYFRWPNGYEESELPPTIGTGFHAVETLGLTLLAGRDFSPQFQSDWLHSTDEHTEAQQGEGNLQAMAILVTEQMAKRAGYDNVDEVVGLQVQGLYRNINATIVGVVKDIKVGSAKDDWLPVSFSAGYSSQSTVRLVVSTEQVNFSQLFNQLRQLLKQFNLTADPQFSLMQQDLAKVYRVEHDLFVLIRNFSVLAMFLSCLGLFGLAAFAAKRQQKQLAIRKVLGATRLSLVNLLAREFLIIVFAAAAIALPLAYWLMDDWLQGFNDRIEQAVWVYGAAALLVALFTWLTVATLAFKAASTRPSLILRYE